MDDGRVIRGDARPFPGHPANPFSDEDLAGKLKENMEPFAGPERTAQLARCLGAVETLNSVCEMTVLLALPDASGVDSAKDE
jgi:2-methylcitrate dehydratase